MSETSTLAPGIDGIPGRDACAVLPVEDRSIAASNENRHPHRKHGGIFRHRAIAEVLALGSFEAHDSIAGLAGANGGFAAGRINLRCSQTLNRLTA